MTDSQEVIIVTVCYRERRQVKSTQGEVPGSKGRSPVVLPMWEHGGIASPPPGVIANQASHHTPGVYVFISHQSHSAPVGRIITSSLQPFLVAGLILCLHFLLSLERMWHSQSPHPKSPSQTVWWPKLQADKDSPYFVDQEINSQELRVKARPPFTTHLLHFINFYNTLLVGIFIERIFVLVIS